MGADDVTWSTEIEGVSYNVRRDLDQPDCFLVERATVSISPRASDYIGSIVVKPGQVYPRRPLMFEGNPLDRVTDEFRVWWLARHPT
jgi:hypothetical protein